jgi:hypothetical protein
MTIPDSLLRAMCRTALVGVVAMLSPHAFGQAATDLAPVENPDSVVVRFPKGSIHSIEMADTALADAAKERAEIEARFSREEQACHSQFFATSCIDKAKDRRRRAFLKLRPVEIEANTYKRQARVVSRDEALANKRGREENDRLEHVKREQESRRSEKAADMRDETAPDAASKPQDDSVTDRSARHEAKLKREREKEASNAAKRAENIAAYERKVQEAQARQAEVAAKKAEKEQKQRAKQSSAPAAP